MKSLFICMCFCAVCIYIVFNTGRHKQHRYFTFDKFGYQTYLPATIIYNDLAHLSFYPAIINKYEPFGTHHTWHYVNFCEDNRKLAKYPPGVSLFNLPLFLVAHLYASNTGNFPADGYSRPYVQAGIFSNILWVTVGLFLLRTFLLRRFTDIAVTVTLACIAFGTNLFYYSAFEQGESSILLRPIRCSTFIYRSMVHISKAKTAFTTFYFIGFTLSHESYRYYRSFYTSFLADI